MLDHINDRNYYSMAYNQQNTAGFQEWRREADRLAVDNSKLRAQLQSMDSNTHTMDGTPIDASYAPKGVDRDILLSDKVANSVKPKLNICSGLNGGSYFVYANKMKAALESGFDATVVPTHGTIENIKNVENGSCDITLAQRDAYDLYSICSNAIDKDVIKACGNAGISTVKGSNLNFTRLSSPFKEAVFGMCKSVPSISDAKTVAIVEGSGSVITWNNLAMEFDSLNDVVVHNAVDMKDAVAKVKAGTADCVFLSVSTKSQFVKNLNKYIDADMHVNNIVNKVIVKIQDPVGEPVYAFKNFDAKVFGKAGKKYSTGFFSSTIRSVTVPTDVIISNKYNAGLAKKIQARIAGLKL